MDEDSRVMRLVSEPLFEEVTAKCGIDTSKLLDNWTWKGKPDQVTSIGTYLLDYDNDGTLDLLVLDMTPHLYRGNGDGTFAETTGAAGLPVLAHYPMATVGDFDNDGDDDLLMDRADGAQWSREVWRNDGGNWLGSQNSICVLTPPVRSSSCASSPRCS